MIETFEGLKLITDGVCAAISNLDHFIKEGLDEELKQPNTFAQHAAWNFCGWVYFKNGRFHEDIYVFKVYQETISAETIEELRAAANEKYGDA